MHPIAPLLITLSIALIPNIALCQTPWQDDGLFWVDLKLIDQDGPEGAVLITNSFLETCDHASPHSLTDWMPYGFQQNQEVRELPDGMCEQILPMRIRGQLDWSPISFLLPWQPGENAHRRIGIPLKEVGHVTISFPDVLFIGANAYQVAESISIRIGKGQRSTSLVIPMRRLARVVASRPDVIITDSGAIPYSMTTHFLLPGERLLKVDSKYLLNVVAVDPQGRQHPLTDPRKPEQDILLSGSWGWTFEVEILPQVRLYRNWLASLPSITK